MSAEPTEGADEDIYRPDAAEFRAVLGKFATGVTIITAMDGDEPVGVAANSFTSVSLDPPLVLFCVARSSTTWPRIERARKFAVNILGEHQEDLCRLFSQKGADRFGQTDWHLGVGGSPVLHDELAYIDCEFWAEYDGGDHIIVVGRVLDLGLDHDAGPLLFYQGQYGRLLPAGERFLTPDDVAAIVVGSDAANVGATVDDLRSCGLRAAGFVGDPATERDALVEMIAELFPARSGEAEPA